jgi:S1-C subfamily serine protease
LNVPATRSDFALLIAATLPDEALTPINRIGDGAIPDVFESYSYGQAVYKLYRAGVLTGSGETGTFFPGRTITRAEAAAIIKRVVDANARVSLSLTTELTGVQIYDKASPAVFFIEVYDDDEERIKTGSGFFICESGIAITNYHVIIGGESAKVTLSDGEVIDVLGIYDYCWKNDAAIIQVEGESFPYLEMADSTRLLTGATVYALGSPLGLQASFSRGIVSQALREIEGSRYIQLDAAISYGSSGGALIDTTGRVVGVTSATMTNSQNINLAVHINVFEDMNRTDYVSFSDILMPATYYDGLYPAPDFGAFFDVKPFDVDSSRGRLTHSYRTSDLPRDVSSILDEYEHLIAQRLFIHFSNTTIGSNSFKNFYNSVHNITISLGTDVVRDQDCVVVTIY